MKKFLVYFVALAVIIGGFIIVTLDVPKWRLYDGQWRPLAMTQAENYCAGKSVGENNSPDVNPEYMASCIAASKLDNETPSIANSLAWACQGFGEATGYPVEECLNAVELYEIWFLKDGGYTTEWNTGNSRPVVAKSDFTKAPRGERQDTGERSSFG